MKSKFIYNGSFKRYKENKCTANSIKSIAIYNRNYLKNRLNGKFQYIARNFYTDNQIA